jgi:proteasome lid subunit RPN8/RPN11
MNDTPTAEVLLQMENHASSSSREVCGLIYDHGYVPIRNISNANDRFYGDPVDLARALASHGEPVAIFHTHPDGNLRLSSFDRRMWYYCNSTMIVGCMQNGQLRWKVYGNRGD